MRRRAFGVFCAAALFVALTPGEAAAEGRVLWTKVEVRPGDDATRIAERLRATLKRATRRARWGKGNKLELRARVTRFDWEEMGDVLRVSCTVVARIVGGQGARSHIRLGGRPDERRKLEKQVLDIVGNGLVTRLADMARAEP